MWERLFPESRIGVMREYVPVIPVPRAAHDGRQAAYQAAYRIPPE
jgi:hypothetical protein